MESLFKFALGAKITYIKPGNGILLIVGRMLDVDDNQESIYITVDDNGHTDWYGSSYIDHNYVVES